ncbi:hypothetical protein GCM10022286_07940 [Gryllotalpicola daejeonensis]|uniref:RAMA domain-containing protein n=1 Tax=Gryllotalpicola daejeonensis TaxID=993087 RepID=A0ABP7ZGJ2_9MICO
MPPSIRVDDEVYEALQARARAFVDTPNAVIRELLGITRTAASAPAGRSLATLLARRWLAPGDPLVWRRRNSGVTVNATVTADGLIEFASGELFDSPTGASSFAAGHRQNGWTAWHVRTGDTLDELWQRSCNTPIPVGRPIWRFSSGGAFAMAWAAEDGALTIVDARGSRMKGALYRAEDSRRRGMLDLDGFLEYRRDDRWFRAARPIGPLAPRDAAALLLGDEPTEDDVWVLYSGTSSTSITSPSAPNETTSSSSDSSGSIA